MSKLLFALFGALLCGGAYAQPFPNKPIRLLVGYAAGGGADVLARLLTAKLSVALGQQITVDNRPGAGGTVAAAVLAKAPADGYTLYFSDASLVTAPAVFEQLPFDPVTGFAAVANVLPASPPPPPTDP